MIKLTLLEEKNLKTFFDDTEYSGSDLYPKLDLTSNRWEIDYESIIVDNYIEIDRSTEMRLDTLARYILGSEDYVDIIVKFNRIINVFEVKKGDVIMIPNLSSFFANIKKANYKTKDIKNSKFNDTSKISGGSKSPSVKTSGNGSKTFRKGTNGVIVF